MASNGSAVQAGQSMLETVIYGATLAEATVAVVGNALVVVAVLSCRTLRHKEMTPLVMLAIADGLVGLTKGYQFAEYVRRLAVKSSWRLYTPRQCFDVGTMTQFAAAQAQAAAMLLLSLDRFLALAYFSRYVSVGRGYTRAIAGAIVGYAALMWAASVGANRTMLDVAQLAPNCLTVPKFPVWWEAVRSVMQPALGFGSVIVYLVVILVYLRRPTSAAEGVLKVQLKRQKRLTVTLSLVTVCTVAFYCLPYTLSVAVKLFTPRPSWKRVLVPLQVVTLANSSVNVFIYIYRQPDMRKAMARLLRCKNPNDNQVSAPAPEIPLQNMTTRRNREPT